MADTSENKPGKHICAALLAHVDAGKTTLSEGLLYLSGNIQKCGRVDRKDTFLDTDAMERERGITIFSKMARMNYKDTQMVLLDTPGHVDFSAEMERTLQVLDYAILVISGTDGVQGHTVTLWRLLERYGIPVFIFINKMDMAGTDKEAILTELQEKLDGNCVDFSQQPELLYESAAMCDEELLEHYLENGFVSTGEIADAVKKRICFPCFFGSALKLEGIEAFLDGINAYGINRVYPESFGAKVYKIGRDRQGNRLTYLKVTGGSLKVRDMLEGSPMGALPGNPAPMQTGILPDKCRDGIWQEKVSGLRLYSGEKYEAVSEVHAGDICVVTGLTRTYPGEGLGVEEDSCLPSLTPALTYRIQLPGDISPAVAVPKLRQMIEEEEPQLHIIWREDLGEIQAQVMGDVQLEVLAALIQERCGFGVSFGEGKILYQESIEDTAEGVGHYEPLRHYAEVHLLLEPLPRGSGLLFSADCPEEMLDGNWQRLVLTHLKEKEHKGVLTGAPITDMRITLIAGKAHLKHTEGGDFRQATYRAVRQGLMRAKTVLLEPYYSFLLEIPGEMTGRAMTDLERMGGSFEPPELEGGKAVLRGSAPVATMQNYQREVVSYTKGNGRLIQWADGYGDCHNAEEVMSKALYDPEQDLDNPCGSIFCAHGSGFHVPWNEVSEHMHLPAYKRRNGAGNVAGNKSFPSDGSFAGNGSLQAGESFTGNESPQAGGSLPENAGTREEPFLGTDEIDAIIDRTFYANQKGKDTQKRPGWKLKKKPPAPAEHTFTPKNTPKKPVGEPYLLVDGYNIIHAWNELAGLAKDNLDSARGRLLDIMCNYQGMKQYNLIVVFDAYKVNGHQTECMVYKNIRVVYTKEAETADQYIEKFSQENGKKYDITVATSDGMEQIIIRGQGCRLLSARELLDDVLRCEEQIRTQWLDNPV